ncbi:MAG: C25 family cysteine peptidase, partial [Bacteroidia bacterium]|nr:C25 family cysteine peptidase [Bacteroidia bacterium]
INQQPGQRIQIQPTEPSALQTVSSTIQRIFKEDEKYNLLRSGRMWFGDLYDLQTTYNYNFPLTNIKAGSNIILKIQVASRSDFANSFTITESNNPIGTITCGTVVTANYESMYAQIRGNTFTIPASSVSDGVLNLTLTYNKQGNAKAWLDWIEIEYEQELRADAGFYSFRSLQANPVPTEFVIQGSNKTIWNVTNGLVPKQIPVTTVGNEMRFILTPDSASEFIAFDNSGFNQPLGIGKVPNQDLHGLPAADYIMISNPDFLSATNQLADFHRNHYNRIVHVVTPEQIYNEYSGGKQDVSAIRDFLKQFYDRQKNTNQPLKYVLFMGDGSFDFKNRIRNSGYLITYQSRNSLLPPRSYVSDDFFGFLDDMEGFWGEGTNLFEGDNRIDQHGVDIGIGRLPASS